MKKYLILILLLMHPTLPLSSENTIDSLRQELLTVQGEERMLILTELVKTYIGVKDHSATIPIYNEILSLYHEGNRLENPEVIHYQLGISYFQIGEYENAMIHQKEALKLSSEANNKSNIALSLAEIGYIYQSQGEYDKAIDNYEQALVLFEELEDKSNQSIILNHFGSTFRKIEEYDKSLEYYMLALDIRKQINDKKGIAGSYNNIAMIYQEWKEYDRALELYFKALELNDELNNQRWKSFNLNNIGYVYLLQNKKDQALDFFQRSLKIKEELNDKRGILHTIGNISSVYDSMGDIEHAISYHMKSLEMAKEIGSNEHILRCYYDLSRLYKRKPDFRTALELLDSYIALKDSLFDQEKIATISDIQTKYETGKKEQEIKLLTKNSEIQQLRLRSLRQFRNLLLIILLLIVILAVLLVQQYKKHRALNKILDFQKKELEKSNAEIENINRNLEKRIREEVSARREQEYKALEQSRMASLGELAAGIAHEINQPLHSIAFTLDNMSMAYEEGDADQAYMRRKIKNMFEDVDRITRIIDHIRTFSRKQSDTDFTPFSINDSIVSGLQMVREQYANHGVHITTDLSDDMPDIMGNFYRFEQVVLIILSNAKDAVEMRAQQSTEDYRQEISIKTYMKKGQITIEFSDNGVGVDSQNRAKIFNPFFTTKEPGRGTGLGLSIAHGIVNTMKGSIKVESSLDKGTKLIITLQESK